MNRAEPEGAGRCRKYLKVQEVHELIEVREVQEGMRRCEKESEGVRRNERE